MGVFGVFDLALSAGVFGQDGGGQAGHFLGDQGQAGAALLHALGELGGILGQGLLHKSAVQRHIQNLRPQLFLRAQRHVGHGHFLQVGDVFFQVFQRVFHLQGAQAAQALAVAGGGNVRLVKHLDGDGIALVDEGGKADQCLLALLDFHQLRQAAKVPAGVACACGMGRSRSRRVIFFNSCSRF